MTEQAASSWRLCLAVPAAAVPLFEAALESLGGALVRDAEADAASCGAERSMDDITWLLEASRTLGGRGVAPGRGDAVPASRLLPSSSSTFSTRSSEGWEVVDGTFDVKSMEDVELG